MGVSSTRVGDHRGSARTVQFLIISLSSPHLRSARARARGGSAEDLAKFRQVSPSSPHPRGVLWSWSCACALGPWREDLAKFRSTVELVFCLGDLAARRRSRRSPHLDLVEDSNQGWQWFCLSSRFDSCAAFLSLFSLLSQHKLADSALCVYVAVLLITYSL